MNRYLHPKESERPYEDMDPHNGAWDEEDPQQCPACRRDINRGDQIARHGGQWMHAICLSDHITRLDVEAAWLVIGGQLARRPGDYTRGETRVIVGQILRVAGGLPVLPVEDGAE